MTRSRSLFCPLKNKCNVFAENLALLQEYIGLNRELCNIVWCMASYIVECECFKRILASRDNFIPQGENHNPKEWVYLSSLTRAKDVLIFQMACN